MTKKQTIELTEDQWRRQLEEAAKIGAEEALGDLKGEVQRLRSAMLSARGLVTQHDLAAYLGVSARTVRKHQGIYGWTRHTMGETVVYWWPEVIEAVTGETPPQGAPGSAAPEEALLAALS